MILGAPALLSLAVSGAASADATSEARDAKAKILVAYFSRSGNTRVIAGTIQRAIAAELFEIRPDRPYPEDYEQTVEQARQERDRGYEPALEARVPDMAAYESVFLGFPIWGETTPPVIRSSNTNPSPRGSGRTSITASPYCPCPPDCFFSRPRWVDVLRID